MGDSPAGGLGTRALGADRLETPAAALTVCEPGKMTEPLEIPGSSANEHGVNQVSCAG